MMMHLCVTCSSGLIEAATQNSGCKMVDEYVSFPLLVLL